MRSNDDELPCYGKCNYVVDNGPHLKHPSGKLFPTDVRSCKGKPACDGCPYHEQRQQLLAEARMMQVAQEERQVA